MRYKCVDFLNDLVLFSSFKKWTKYKLKFDYATIDFNNKKDFCHIADAYTSVKNWRSYT